MAPYDGDQATAVTRETAAASATVDSLEDPDAAAGHSLPLGLMSSEDARHPSWPSSQFHYTFRPEIVAEHEFEADAEDLRSIESLLYYFLGVTPLQA